MSRFTLDERLASKAWSTIMRTLVEGHAHAGAVGLLQIERLHHLAHVLPAELPPGLLVDYRDNYID